MQSITMKSDGETDPVVVNFEDPPPPPTRQTIPSSEALLSTDTLLAGAFLSV